MVKSNEKEILKKLNRVEIDSGKFLQVKETLTRIGIPSIRNKVLNQTCHILHKKGEFYIVHFKEMFKLDGNNIKLSKEDLARRDKITALLEKWNLCKVKTELKHKNSVDDCYFHVVKYTDKPNWTLTSKYNFGENNGR